MKTSLAIATLALALLQTCGAARAATLASELKGRDGWVALHRNDWLSASSAGGVPSRRALEQLATFPDRQQNAGGSYEGE